MKLSRHRPDFIMIIAILLLVSIGLLTIYSASTIWAFQEKGLSPHYFFIKQCVWSLLGLGGMFFAMNMPFWYWRKLFPIMLLASFITLLLVFVFPDINGAHRWIGIAGFTFQPSELATLTIVVYMAHILTKKQELLGDFKKGVVPPLILTAVFAGLVVLEPDMDAAALIAVTALITMFAGGVPLKYLMRLLLPAGFLAVLLVTFSSYRRARIFGFLDPFSEANKLGDGWQVRHSLYAIASGGWTGKGLGHSVEKFLYLPEPHTDFIFAIFLEEWGTFAGILLISLFGILIWRAIRIVQLLPDHFGALLAIGITSMIGIAVVVNIGMVTGSLPVMGIPLPFITYGGTALLIKMTAMGILLNLSRYTVEDPRLGRR